LCANAKTITKKIKKKKQRKAHLEITFLVW